MRTSSSTGSHPGFPHLKECGPIEAKYECVLLGLDGGRFPHLKECGPIEASVSFAKLANAKNFPHLKECGPIEASPIVEDAGSGKLLSALERVRPH